MRRIPATAGLAKNAPSPTNVPVEREDGASKGRYRKVIDGNAADMTYSRAGDKLIIIDHTEVPTPLRFHLGPCRRIVGPCSSSGLSVRPGSRFGAYPRFQGAPIHVVSSLY